MNITTNISALIAFNSLDKSNESLARSTQRLSSGLKVNKARDDASGIAISNKMKAQIRGLQNANENASNGISIIETAEGALSEIHSILQRMNELSVQASNGVYQDEDREATQNEINQLRNEITRIAENTEFNDKKLLGGDLDLMGYSNVKGVNVNYYSDEVPVGKYEFTVVSVAVKEVITGDTVPLGSRGTVKADEAGMIKINGNEINIREGMTWDEVKETVRDVSEKSGVVATYSARNEFVFEAKDAASKINITWDDADSKSNKLARKLGINDSGLAKLPNPPQKDMVVSLTTTPIPATANNAFAKTAVASCSGNTLTVTDMNGFKIEVEAPLMGIAGTKVELDLKGIGAMRLQIGANEGQTLDVRIPTINMKSMGLENLDLRTEINAKKGIGEIANAVSYVSEVRSRLGAYQNRLESTMTSMDITEENMTAAYSRIMDVDMADEMTKYTTYQVLTQAGTSVLSQANQQPQQVLQLLQ